MNNSFQIKQEDKTLTISGDLTFKTVESILKKTREAIQKKEIVAIDFSNVKHVDSSAMALLVEWRRLNKDIQWIKLPDQLRNLLKMSDLEIRG